VGYSATDCPRQEEPAELGNPSIAAHNIGAATASRIATDRPAM